MVVCAKNVPQTKLAESDGPGCQQPRLCASSGFETRALRLSERVNSCSYAECCAIQPLSISSLPPLPPPKTHKNRTTIFKNYSPPIAFTTPPHKPSPITTKQSARARVHDPRTKLRNEEFAYFSLKYTTSFQPLRFLLGACTSGTWDADAVEWKLR